jgi:hypothetical protein
MSEIIVPLILTFAGLITAFMAYRGIRRGGARFYTLEREAILQRAGLTVLGSAALFLFANGLLIYERQQEVALEATAAAVEESGTPLSTPTPVIGLQFPNTETPTPTIDATIPTATATPIICRAVVENTSFGLYLRDAPNGEDIDLLPEGSVVTLLADEPAEANGFTWRRVRAVGGDEGWVAQDFLTIGSTCGGQ